VQEVVPLVIVTVPLEIEHPPDVVMVTVSPELAVADTGNVELYVALAGAAGFTVIVCGAVPTAIDTLALVAEL